MSTNEQQPVSIPLVPLDDPTVTDPLVCPELKWGFIGCGRVSHDFVQALKHIPSQQAVACATSNDVGRAQEFATKHSIAKAYGTYEELLKDPDVQIAYIGNVHVFRRTIVEQCIQAKKHVLVEKPFACTYDDAVYLINLAKEANVFIMEGMWTRFFPAVEKARQICLSDGALGEIVNVTSDFNFNASDSEIYPTSFFYNRKLGGGATLLTSPYPIGAATLFYKSAMPDVIKVTGQVDQNTEVDLQAGVLLSYPPTSTIAPAVDESNTTENTPKLPGTGVACLCYGMLGESEETTTVVGTKGRLVIETPSHCPTTVTVRLKGYGRGNAAETTIYHYPLPTDTEEIIKAGGYYYPNSAGFAYEAAAVARCIAAGKTECPQYTLAETLIQMKILDEIRSQLHLKSIYDD